METQEKPDCYQCKFRKTTAWSHHSICQNSTANVEGNAHGIKNGWFAWPFNFDPVWLDACDGFEAKTQAPVAQR